MKPIPAQHKYALTYEMTTDALNFGELAFRQTESRRLPCPPQPHQPPPQPRPFPGLAGAVVISHPRAGRPRVVGGTRRGGAGRQLPLSRGKRASLPPGATGIPSCELASTAEEGCFSGLFRALPALPFSIRTIQYKAEAEWVA